MLNDQNCAHSGNHANIEEMGGAALKQFGVKPPETRHPSQPETTPQLGFPYFRQSMRDESEPAVICTVEHPQGLGVDDPRLDPNLAEKLRAFVAARVPN